MKIIFYFHKDDSGVDDHTTAPKIMSYAAAASHGGGQSGSYRYDMKSYLCIIKGAQTFLKKKRLVLFIEGNWDQTYFICHVDQSVTEFKISVSY